ncbi:recombinase family protein [Acutalibacter muris]|uniref:recombinase family protein n=1 Tax=Acutalibacter muris TaxID=1796620 RepID=UPI00272C7A93|nr:recombinase family protein [Acutalibacter muris]
MKNAVIYARYSAGPNQTEQSIEGQLRVCTEYAEKNDLRIVGTYIDRKISGKTDNRREFQRMIDDSGKKIFEVVIMYQTDRFARNRYDSAVYKHALRKNGVEIKYATTNIPEGPEGIILESLMEGLAEYYSAELSQKIKRGMRESALKCHSTGAGHSLGYRTAPDKSIVIEPDGAKAVQIIFDMYIKGRSQVEICDHLNGLGLRTVQGKPFGKNSINKIIKNKRYIGVYSYDDIVIEDGIPAIISKDTFRLAQLEMERRRTRKRPKSPKAEYLLSGKAFCGHCQKPLTGVSGTGRSGNKWYYYYCPDSRAKKGCDKKPVRREWLEDYVVQTTIQAVLQPEIIKHVSEKCYEMQLHYREDNSDVLYFENKLAEVKKAIKNTLKAIESGVITKTLPARLAELENEQESIEAELAIAKATDVVITPEQIEFLLWQFSQPQEGETEDDYRRRIIKCFVHKVFLFDDKLLLYYNVSRDGKTREQSNVELLEGALSAGFNQRFSGSTKTANHKVKPCGWFLVLYVWIGYLPPSEVLFYSIEKKVFRLRN